MAEPAVDDETTRMPAAEFDTDDLLTVAAAASIARKSTRTIRRVYRSGLLPAYRDGNGRTVRVRYGDLRTWMMATAAEASGDDGAELPIDQVSSAWRSGRCRSVRSGNMRLLEAVRQHQRG